MDFPRDSASGKLNGGIAPNVSRSTYFENFATVTAEVLQTDPAHTIIRGVQLKGICRSGKSYIVVKIARFPESGEKMPAEIGKWRTINIMIVTIHRRRI